MAAPTGLINGTKVLLLKGASDQVIGAIVSNSASYSRALIEVTNKSSEQFRELLTGDEGTRTVDFNCECFFSSDATYQAMRTAWKTGAIDEYKLAVDGVIKTQKFYASVENFSDSFNLNEAVKTTFTLKSSSSHGDLFE